MRTLALIVVLGAAAPALAKPPAAPPPAAPTAVAIERRLHSENIDASSFLWNDWNKLVENYHPNYVADDDPATAWVEGAKGSGVGEWLHIQTTPLELTTRIRLRVRNGYQKSKDLFRANARAKDVTVRLLPSKVERKVTLADQDGWQDLAVDQPSGLVGTVELTVTSVYEGSKYEDLCISDVQVFATSQTPDNPAFEKSKHAALMAWRAARLSAARTFASRKTELPLYPAYAIDTGELKFDSDSDLAGMVDAATKDPAFAKEWKAALAVAANVADGLDALPRAQIAPTAMTKLVEADGLQIARVQNVADGLGGGGYYDEGALRLPMLDYVSTLFAGQLRMLDVKDATKVSAYLADEGRCKADVTWVRRAQAKEKDGPAQVQALVVGRCAKVSSRSGSFNTRAVELYVYDGAGHLVLSVGSGHIDGYRWIDDAGRPMLAGGRALLSQGSIVEAKKRVAVAAK